MASAAKGSGRAGGNRAGKARPTPAQRDRPEKGVRKQRARDLQVVGDSTAKVASQENRAQNGRARNHIKYRAGEERDSEREDYALGISELDGSLHYRHGLYEFPHGVREEKQGQQTAEDTRSRPSSSSRSKHCNYSEP